MIKSQKFLFLLLAAAFLFPLLAPPAAFSQTEGLSLTVAPTLTRLNLAPGETWRSLLRVVNTNPYELTLYASVVDFEAQGEEGHGRFKPVLEVTPETITHSLAQWIEINQEPFTLKPGQSINLPFSINAPNEAEPGGHYAAILIGTQPAKSEAEGAVIRVASYVSSLIFITIKGEVLESGFIREFVSQNRFYQKPEVNFRLRFENIGNVHLQPQGDITIYNMWGKERGKILVNHKSQFGNVLPGTVRKFEFTWRSEENFFDIGPYKAVATLTYGQNFRQTAIKSTTFWIVPLKPVAGVLGGFIFLVLTIVWLIRAYIRRLMKAETLKTGLNLAALAQPLRQEVVDLRKIVKSPHGAEEHEYQTEKRENAKAVPIIPLVLKRTYKFWIFILAVLGLILFLGFYFRHTFTPNRPYEIEIFK